jgi:polar amino acid transport system ATP-binding protein
VIEIFGIRKQWGDRTILDDVSARFEAGTVTAIVGPSGGGKSTLLRCINGLERFDEGRIVAGGVELRALSGKASLSRVERAALQRLRLEVGMVFQQYGLFAHMTALENVCEAPVHVLGVPLEAAKKRAVTLLERVGVGHRLAAYPRALSGGEQQRVAIARALAMEPKALLLDEPTSALDSERKAEVASLLRSFAAEGKTLVLVSHEPAFVRDLCDRVIVLRGGKVAADGAPGEVLANEP